MSAKHTPGPWTFGTIRHDYDENDNPQRVVVDKHFDYRGKGYSGNPGIFGPNDESIVDCGGEYYLFSGPADARLLTSAPDLLAALQLCLDTLKQANCQTGFCCCGMAIDKHSSSDNHGPIDEGVYYQRAAIDDASAAIARATGEQA